MECSIGMAGRAITLAEFNLVGQCIMPDQIVKENWQFIFNIFTNEFKFYKVDRKTTLN